MTISPFKVKDQKSDTTKCPQREGLEKIHNHIEHCITHFESANDNNQEIPIHSYKMVLYELSEMTKKLLASE